MRDEETFFFLVLCAVFVVVVVRMRHAHTERVQRLRILENAMQDPKVDPSTRQELIRTLDQRGASGLFGTWRAWMVENLTPRRVFAVVAWCLLLVGTLLVSLGRSYEFSTGMSLIGVGLAVLALPIVLRELDARAARR